MDLTRINGVEYRDERDVTLARAGFAVTGGAALILAVLEAVVATFVATFTTPLIALIVTLLACGQLLALCTVWGIANWRVVRHH